MPEITLTNYKPAARCKNLGFDVMYDNYKPLRNMVRQFALEDSLQTIWFYVQHVHANKPLPRHLQPIGNGRPLDLKRLMYPWQLSTLIREMILHAGSSGSRSLRNWNDMALVLNKISATGESFTPSLEEADELYLELHRIGHQQLPWQNKTTIAHLMRYMLIYQHGALQSTFERSIGVSHNDFFFLGFAVAGGFERTPRLDTDTDYSVVGIDNNARDVFFRRMVSGIAKLRQETMKVQQYGPSWEYTFNPLQARPLVALDPNFPNRVYCPIPAFAMGRITDGIFYDIASAPGFDHAFGDAFQAYVGRVIKEAGLTHFFQLWEEKSYMVGKKIKHGIDWTLTDASGNLFIECKTKRMSFDAKVTSDGVALHAQLDVLADAIFQNYRNILDALEGRSHWLPNPLPSYNLIVTLEDWMLFSNIAAEELRIKVQEKLVKSGVGLELLERVPYTVANAAEFEMICCAMHKDGIDRFFSRKTDATHASWLVSTYTKTFYKGASHQSRRLFHAELRAFFASRAAPSGMMSEATD